MSCNPNQDQFIWPLEYENIVRPTESDTVADGPENENIKHEWALADYDEPEEENSDEKGLAKVTSKPVEKVRVITKIRYFLSEEQANAFIASCW